MKLSRLLRGRTSIESAAHAQGWRPGPPSMHDRASGEVSSAAIVIGVTQKNRYKVRDVRNEVLSNEVGDRGNRNSRAEARVLCNEPCGQVASVADTCNSHSCRVHEAFFGEM